MGAQVYDPSAQKTEPGPVTTHDLKANLEPTGFQYILSYRTRPFLIIVTTTTTTIIITIIIICVRKESP